MKPVPTRPPAHPSVSCFIVVHQRRTCDEQLDLSLHFRAYSHTCTQLSPSPLLKRKALYNLLMSTNKIMLTKITYFIIIHLKSLQFYVTRAIRSQTADVIKSKLIPAVNTRCKKNSISYNSIKFASFLNIGVVKASYFKF